MLLATAAVLAVTAGCGFGRKLRHGQRGGQRGGEHGQRHRGRHGGRHHEHGGWRLFAASGFATPQAPAVSGFVRTELAGRWVAAVLLLCPGQAVRLHQRRQQYAGQADRKLTVDGAVVSGKRAMVKVTGHICLSGKTECQGNTDPQLGLPTGLEMFTQAYDKVVAGGFSPVPCIKVNGRWYAGQLTRGVRSSQTD